MARNSPLLSVSSTDGPHGLVLSLRGEIDPVTEPLLNGWLLAALAESPTSLVLDLGGVTFFSVGALNALLHAHQVAADVRCRFELRSVPSMVERVIRISGSAELLAVSTTGERAGAV